jgi:tripartite-type tricarboxylate transporter receptor subunit TctC
VPFAGNGPALTALLDGQVEISFERKFEANVSRLLNSRTIHQLKYLAAKLDVLTNAKEIVGIVASPFEGAL